MSTPPPCRRRSPMRGPAFGGTWHETPIHDRAAFRPGHAVDGPAIVNEANATTVVEPGWRAEVTRPQPYDPAARGGAAVAGSGGNPRRSGHAGGVQ